MSKKSDRETEPTSTLEVVVKKDFHPVADLFPLMEGPESEALVADIKENGLRQPIVLYEGKILDGRNRYEACIKAKVEPEYEQWDGKGSPWAYVWSMNAERRHLEQDQKAAIGIKCKRGDAEWMQERESIRKKEHLPRKSGKFQPSVSRDTDGGRREREELAKETDVSPATMGRVIELEKKDPEAFELVAQGKTKAVKALRKIKEKEYRKRLKEIESQPVQEHNQLYDVIVIDPPWQMHRIGHENQTDKVKLLDYPVMTLDEIAILEIPAADDCHLWL